MKKLSRKTTYVCNAILLSLIAIVFAVSFLPQRAVYIYGGSADGAIYKGNTLKNNVSLMFNVYENTDVVCDIVDALDARGIKATFFVGGCWADDNEQALCKINKSGHEIGNHGYFHKSHKKLDYSGNEKEISNNHAVVKALCGVEMNLFAPPSGDFSALTIEVASALNYKVIMWSKDTIDWRDSNQNLIYSRATKNLSNGDLILMHPKKHTLKVLDRIIDYIESAGFKIVTVSENIAD